MKPDKFTVYVGEIQDGYMAPEEFKARALQRWKREARANEVTLLAMSPPVDAKRDDGQSVLAWCVDADEDMYLVLLAANGDTAKAEYHGKAEKES